MKKVHSIREIENDKIIKSLSENRIALFDNAGILEVLQIRYFALFKDPVDNEYVVYIPDIEMTDERLFSIKPIFLNKQGIPFISKKPIGGTLDFESTTSIAEVTQNYNRDNNPNLLGEFIYCGVIGNSKEKSRVIH